MSMDKNTIKEKLSKLAQSVNLLEKYKKISREDFLVDPTVNSATLYNLVLSIEIVIDIGSHILNEEYQVSPKEYSEVIEKLGEYEIIPADFAQENVNMARFRNLLIHDYVKIDLGQVYNNLQKAPDVFRQFAKYYIDFLEKQ